MPSNLPGGSLSTPHAAAPTGGAAAVAGDERVRGLAEALHEQQARVAAALGRLRGGERLDTRGRSANGSVGPVATLNGTLCSTNRPIIALLETHQQADGSVRVPEALRPYLGGLAVLKPVTE